MGCLKPGREIGNKKGRENENNKVSGYTHFDRQWHIPAAAQ
jgi:hypothetical protein